MCKIFENLYSLKLCIFTSSIFQFLSILPQSVSMAVEVPFIPKHILIYGGNGFIGSSTAERLIQAGHKLTLVNRGNWYWDTGFTVMPYVQHIKCDRLQAVDKCTSLEEYVANVEQIDTVIDFSAYHVQALADTLKLVHSKTKLYIYISTDSVYEVCLKNHTGSTKESDAVRPETEESQDKLRSWEEYGHRKLQCEEYLTQFSKDNYGPHYIILRLPDVVGPRDNTYRWWTYQLWMKLRSYLEKDITVPTKYETQPMSFVYVEDVADVIYKLVHNIFPNAYDQAYNLALKETFTLKQFLEDMRTELNVTNVNISVDNQPGAVRLFPSVSLGPLDTTKAEQLLQWTPTPWSKVLKDTCFFYENVIKLHHIDKPRRDMIRTLQSYLTSKPNDVFRGLRDIYDLGYSVPKDEL